jgi:hypothetical protein
MDPARRQILAVSHFTRILNRIYEYEAYIWL